MHRLALLVLAAAAAATISTASASAAPATVHVAWAKRGRHARSILVECPKRSDGQDWDGQNLLELLPKCDILIAAEDCKHQQIRY